MTKKKIKGIVDELDAQFKERYGSDDNIKQIQNNDESKLKNKVDRNPKTIYLTGEIIKALKRCAFEEECEQSNVVAEALEIHLKAKGYLSE